MESETVCKIHIILDWANESNPKFVTNFVNSVLEWHKKGNQITFKQIDAIDNIYEKFKVGEYLEKKNRKNR